MPSKRNNTSRLLVILGILCFSIFSQTKAQISKYIYENLTVIDGLPSNNCYSIFEDHEGIIWIGTDSGLVTFDGQTFKKHNKTNGLNETVILTITEDSNHRIWVSGVNNMIYRLERENGYFTPFEENSKIQKLLKENYNETQIEDIFFRKDSIEIHLENHDLIHIYKDQVHFKKLSIYDQFTHNRQNSDVMFRSREVKIKYNFDSLRLRATDIDTIIYKNLENNPAHLKTYATSFANQIRIGISDYILLKKHDQLLIKEQSGILKEIKTINEGIIFCFLDKKGVNLYSKADLSLMDTIISDISATGFIVDKNGGYWISSLTQGVFYIRNPSIRYVNLDCKDVFFNHIESSEEEIFASRFDGNLFSLDENRNTFLIKNNGFENSILSYNSITKTLWYSYLGQIYTTQSTQPITNITSSIKSVDFKKNKTWIAGFQGRMIELKASNENATTILNNEKNKRILKKILSIEEYNNNLYIGTTNGLVQKLRTPKEQYEYVPLLKSVRIEKLESGPNSELIIATKNRGLGFLFSNDSLVFIDKSLGLISNDIENIFLDSENNLWVCSLEGISKLKNYLSPDRVIENWTLSHGLPSPDSYDITEFDNKMYVATGNGIITMNKDLDRKNKTPSPFIQNVLVNQIDQSLSHDLTFTHRENNITLHFNTLNYAHRKVPNNRFRINNSDWNYINLNYINLLNLKPNTYQIEIQAQNEYGVWSSSTTIDFEINKPWWKTSIFIVSVFLFLLFSTLSILKNRLNNIAKKNELKQEIQQLEKSALSAQMSPHFIFNCLHSIQQFVRNNDKIIAMEYLAKFSRLIRMYLNNSVHDTVSIADEIQMLNHYLELERLRFQECFTYSLQIENDISPDTAIPSMLIQPFVESAIIEGTDPQNKPNGKIKIIMKVLDKKLHVAIHYHHNKNKKTIINLDSHGIETTKKRVNLLTKNSQDSFLKRIHTDNGTIIRLIIPLIYESV